MKRLLFLVLASFLLVAACGQKENEETKTEEKKKDTKKESKKEDTKKEKQLQSDEQTQDNNEQNQNVNEQTQVIPQQEQNYENQAPEQNVTQQPTGGTDAGMIDYDEVERILEENRQNAQNAQSDEPRSLRQIKEETGRGASEFTQEEIDEANAYARQH